ncbi:hypothetical protein L228DRAFT_245307 [Xylona heveae TC161]|uniref:F-box domain-containing protein n=1 Tax=Xylona heveae (strain CBS 132557 / TC161) TaxID=1328760 RepID=A0A165I4U8_XYLHT|nr:hypothetical protein L228DRAFT_245307 [Xylona heveae TC161]KZF24383.1 hypothetical protein L228DRAFT_245307 [Xylona heveae TC161]
MDGESNPELESFRQKWRDEVSARTRQTGGRRGQTAITRNQNFPAAETFASSSASRSGPRIPPLPTENRDYANEKGEDEVDPKAYHDLEVKRQGGRKLSDAGKRIQENWQPQSALEHYEKAVERETQGVLGDSLSLYRKAFRLDSSVDKAYKNKHFPPSAFPPKPANKASSTPTAAAAVPRAAQDSTHGLPASISELISGFSGLSIPAEPPPTDASPPPPCPIAAIPEEVLVEILVHAAVTDVATLSMLARVCKRLAYLVGTEERIWKRVCCGDKFGFPAMHYDWQCTILGEPYIGEGDQLLGPGDFPEKHDGTGFVGTDPLTLSLLHETYASSWRLMFRSRPRIRFNGCYISTVNYLRPGSASPMQLTWNTPIHIVTYYRYLRFFRDGTAISLLTTAEPIDVVHHLVKENLHKNHTGNLPSAVMKPALRGRWRLSGPASKSSTEEEEEEGDLHVETEGVDPKYMYRMQFAMRSGGRGARNNKLAWKGYWSYNRLTDDWGEFGLRNDRAYVWSRVKSYGMGY